MAEQLLNGRYRLLRPLGTGGMASVYLAEDLRLGRRVAVKILHPQFAADPTFVARFEQEARIAAALSHPNLVQVYDVGHDGDRHYIVMEYVEGETLKDLIARQGALPVPRALEIIGGVLAALDIAHAHHLIHRDVKAQNILLTSGGDVKVTDFGIARELSGAATSTLTATGMVIGTVHYFSPEQAQGRPATPQSDLYAAGVVLYEMLTGTLPFNAENPLAVAMQQINQAPPLPTRLNAAVPPSVEAIVLKAMAKNPANRFASAAEMKAAVAAARSGAGEPTRRTTRVTPAAPVDQRPATPPGVIRSPTRPLPQAVVQEAPAGRAAQRALWLIALALIAVIAAILGLYFGGHLPGFGGTATPTPTPSQTPTPSATNTPAPTATRRVIILPPTATDTATPSPSPTKRPIHKPTATATPSTLPTATATATTTRRPTRTPTATSAPTDTATTTPTSPPTATETDTPAPTATETPTAPPTATDTETPTPQPTDTDTPVPTDTAVTPTDTDTPVATDTPAATVAPTPSGPPIITLSPTTGSSGSIITVTGANWPDGALVSLSADFGNGPEKLGSVTATGGSFATTITVPPDASPGIFMIRAVDTAGSSTSQTLTVT